MRPKYFLQLIPVLFITVMAFDYTAVYSQERKNMLGICIDFVQDQSYGYIEEPYNQWVDVLPDPAFHLYYHYKVSPYFQFGPYMEYVSSSIERALPDEKLTRFNLGISCLGRYPDYIVNWQVGAYLAPGIIFAKEIDDKFTGVDYGMIAGPAVEYKQFGIAFHIHAGYARYSSNGEVEKIRYHNPRFFLKLNYAF